MQKLIKNPIFMFMLGAITLGSLGTVFAYSIIASSVGFTPVDNTWNVENAGAALDDLYDKLKIKIDFDNVPIEKTLGDTNSTRSVSKSLEKGRYILYVTYAVGQLQYASGGTNYNTDLTNPSLLSLTCQKNCTTRLFSRYRGNHVSSGTVNSVHSNLELEQVLYLVEINDEVDMLTITGNSKTINYETNGVSAFILKIK